MIPRHHPKFRNVFFSTDTRLPLAASMAGDCLMMNGFLFGRNKKTNKKRKHSSNDECLEMSWDFKERQSPLVPSKKGSPAQASKNHPNNKILLGAFSVVSGSSGGASTIGSFKRDVVLGIELEQHQATSRPTFALKIDRWELCGNGFAVACLGRMGL